MYTNILGKINVLRGTKGKMTAVDDEYFKDIYQVLWFMYEEYLSANESF